jgi:hypothetical protein
VRIVVDILGSRWPRYPMSVQAQVPQAQVPQAQVPSRAAEKGKREIVETGKLAVLDFYFEHPTGTYAASGEYRG